jgi:hypothetical protein
MSPREARFDPIRLKVSGGWVLVKISRDEPKTYVFQNKNFPNLVLEVIESFLPDWLQPYSSWNNKTKRKKEYLVEISKRYGFQESLHAKKYKTFAGIFRDSELKNLCKFYESREKTKQNKDNLYSSQKKDLEEVYSWIYEKVKNIPHEWYSPYGLVVFDETIPLESGRHEFTSYQVQKRNGKTYIDFPIPVGIFEKQ